MADQVSPAAHAAYERIHDSAEFAHLQATYLRFVLPTTVAFLVWYLTYVLCSNYAGDFMGTEVVGNINIALVFGLLQFVTTFGIAWWYARYSVAKMDPVATALREEFEAEVER